MYSFVVGFLVYALLAKFGAEPETVEVREPNPLGAPCCAQGRKLRRNKTVSGFSFLVSRCETSATASESIESLILTPKPRRVSGALCGFRYGRSFKSEPLPKLVHQEPLGGKVHVLGFIREHHEVGGRTDCCVM